ncbi:unnamed protein product [Chironomus riparius]|uniref:Uncharacterized protein n=1 Tax=Chironomus riparius TaxID=315576 RepID=A0A9N9RKH3_9DIPT|nr:unnamed protein product [Chironomus riparius]
MYVKCLMLMLLSCHISFSYENERDAKLLSFEKYPMKVAYVNAPGGQQQYQYGKLLKVKSVNDQNSRKFKRANSDNVKGELTAQSRKDIFNIQRPKFHGRDRPSAEALTGNNSTEFGRKLSNFSAKSSELSQESSEYPQNPLEFPKNSQQSSESQNPQKSLSHTPKRNPDKASQRNDVYSKPSRKNKPKKKSQHLSKSNAVEDIPPYVPDNSPFYPLMKPSPINVMPTQPPSFDAVRNYVQYLKMRQQKFFSEFENDKEPVAELKSQQPYEGEIDYFKEREQELAHEAQFSPVNYIKNVQSSEDTEELPYTDESSSNESEAITNNEENANIHRVDNDDYAANSDDYNDSNYADYADETIEEDESDGDESRKKENFVPFRLYAQVRHVEADHHEKPSKSNIKEKVSLSKKNVYYKEEGYEDKNYDHGAEKIDYDKRNKQHKRRGKRSTDGDVDVSQLPVALAYFKKSEIPQLTGEKLFKHLDELIKNSSIYLPDEDDVRPVKFGPIRPSIKYPNYSIFPGTIRPQLTADRYSENYPKLKNSLYASKNVKECDEIEDDINPVPSDIEEEDKPTKYNKSPKRLNKLGDKIQCYREKYFGKDPFDNPLFKEDEYVEAAIPIPVNHIAHQANPLITVYDDVINNIRSGILNDYKKKREAEDIQKNPSEQVLARTRKAQIPNYSSVSGISNLPIFDINTFLPKFRGTFSKFSEEVENSKEQEPTTVRNNHSNQSLEDQQLDPPNPIEKPKVKRNNINKKKKKASIQLNQLESPPKLISTVIQPAKIVKNQKYRRFISPNTFAHPTKHITTFYPHQQPQQIVHSNGKSTYRFNFL